MEQKNKVVFKYIESFDTLRGFGTILVMLIHGSYDMLPGGFVPLELFFVLSGYLITSLLHTEFQNTGNISFSKFYIRRGLKLFPALIITVLLANVLWAHQLAYVNPNRGLATMSALFYFTNLVSDVCGNMTHLWSLAVEEHFYFFWPMLALFVVFKLPFRYRMFFLGGVIFLLSLFKIVVFHTSWHYGFFTVDPYRFTLCRIDGILMGAVLSLSIHKIKINSLEKLSNNKITLLITATIFLLLTLLCTLNLKNVVWGNGGFILVNLFCTFIIFVTIKYANHFMFSNKLLRWVGKRSYGIYVYHFPIFLALEDLRQPHSMMNFILVNVLRFSLSFAFAALSYKYVEVPILKYKKKFEAEKRSQKELTKTPFQS